MKTNRHSQRGSLLIVAMILASVIAISLASYLQLGRTALTVSNRALYNNAAMNLAENGLEEAMFAINKYTADPASYDWSTWSNDGTNAWRSWSGYTFDQNATGVMRVYILNYLSTAAPEAVARSTVTLGGGDTRTVEKWVRIQLRRTSKFANGLVAKDSITFKGSTASVNSWNSEVDHDSNPLTAAVITPYSDAVKNDNGSVGSISISNEAVDVQNADIWGYASTGGALPSVGPNGLVGSYGPPATTAGTMEMDRVSTDFSASFDPVEAPSDYAYNVIASITIPNPASSLTLPGTATAAADGKYYISSDQISFNNKTLIIEAGKEVVLKLTNTSTAIAIGGGSGAISIASGATLAIYTEGDITIGGNGISNGVDDADAGTTIENDEMGQPKQFQIWGTKTSGTQSIDIAGNGVLSAIVYAPQGSVKINGNGDVAGSVVANDITVVGSAKFHYDESLANFGGDNPFRVSRWEELTLAADRAVYADELDFP
jgi:hypothetical protein